MGWDGVPEHRGLRGQGEQPPDARTAQQRHQDHLARINAYREAAGGQVPQGGEAQMPPDPFSGTLPGAIAQAEMLHSLIEGGMTEPQALYYLACLVQVGLAMRLGRFTGDLPPWPPEAR